MSRRFRLLLPLSALALLSAAGVATQRLRAPNPMALGYEARTLQGFQLFVSPELQDHPDLMERLEWRLDEQLALVSRTLPAPHVRLLREETPIYLELDPDWERDSDGMRVGNEYLAYYRGRFLPWRSLQYTWTVLREGVPRDVGAITVPHPSTLIQSHAGHPTLMLHEFAHAFEDLKFNFASPAIQVAYDRAHAARLYRDDLTSDHYADRNPREYFASLTEIYFGLTKDKAPPNTPAALKALDPDGYAAIAAAWSVNPKAP